MPMSLDEYRVAQRFMVAKMQQKHTKGNEGVEVLENRPYEDETFGKGQYTSKIYRLQSKVPPWLTTFAPADALTIEEEAWNAYPKCKAVLKCPYFTKFSLTIETVHVGDKGQSKNVHNLNEEQLAARQVEFLDIALPTKDSWSYVVGASSIDFSKFKSAKSGRGPLTVGWQDRCDPVMTAYKLVTIDAPYWGFGYRLEQALLAGERALFLESHRNCFGWIDEWFGMTLKQVFELEQQIITSLNQQIRNSKNEDEEEDPDLECEADNEGIQIKS
ncbi:Phosphatidylinositol transfer protein [Dillenia turbinata]|uniref:Phosphatidylinositol transfer protein n=1 Tax=Dillenia turbinata TaxID=194707 RepID=A0AAN8VJ34_9MAGN